MGGLLFFTKGNTMAKSKVKVVSTGEKDTFKVVLPHQKQKPAPDAVVNVTEATGKTQVAKPAATPAKGKAAAKAPKGKPAKDTGPVPAPGLVVLEVNGKPKLWAPGEQLSSVETMAETRRVLAEHKASGKREWIMPKYDPNKYNGPAQPNPADAVRTEEEELLAKANAHHKQQMAALKEPLPVKGGRTKITPGTVVKEREAKTPRVARDPNKPGVIDTIVKVLSATKKPLTFEELDAQVAAIVGREPGACLSTIRAQLGGTRLATEKGVNVEKTGAAKPFKYRIIAG